MGQIYNYIRNLSGLLLIIIMLTSCYLKPSANDDFSVSLIEEPAQTQKYQSSDNSAEKLDKEKLIMFQHQQDKRVKDLEQRVQKIVDEELLKINNKIADQQKVDNEIKIKLSEEINKLSDKIDSYKSKSFGNVSSDGNLSLVENKMKIIEDKLFYQDSLRFELINDLVRIENKIVSLANSYQEMIELKSTGALEETPPISDEEYRKKYIEALTAYQNSEFSKSLNQFNMLISANKNHALADNCQYWIGEIYYSKKDYRRSISAFENVFDFAGTNKSDDAYYKLGLCYYQLQDYNKSINNFQKLIDYYPQSEFVNKSKKQILELKNRISY